MALASMINFDEDALICDLAETYHIYDYRSLPVRLAATLSAGLRDDSRIRMAAAGSPVSQDTGLLAVIADRIDVIRYMFSDNETKRAHPMVSVTEAIFGKAIEKEKESDIVGFESSQAFEAELAGIRGE